MPHLLTLHNRAHVVLPAAEATRMRESVLAASFGRDWNVIHAAHRSHHHQEVRLSASPCHHLILHLGKPLRVRLGFAGGKPTARTVARGVATMIPHGATSEWLWEPYEGKEADPRAEFVHLYLTSEVFAQVATEMEVDPRRVEIAGALGVSDPTLWRIGETLQNELGTARPGSRLVAEAAACQLAVHLLRRHLASNARARESQHAALTPAHLRRATDFIREHLDRDIGLAEIAGAAGMSVFHFARLFKNATGLSPYQYLLRERIERAKTLLRNPEFSIGYIAHCVGFDSHSRFSAQFRRAVGMSPSEYRK